MKTLRDLLSTWISGGIRRAFPGVEGISGEVRPAVQEAFGDYQWNGAMGAARVLGCGPVQVAEAVRGALVELPLVEKVEVGGPGFLNLRLEGEKFGRWLEELCGDRFHGVPQVGAGERYIIDYSSPNVAKPMHIAHIRSTVIGDALKRIHRALGREVLGDNHLGDWGTQFGVLIMGFRRFADEAKLAASPVDELQRVYILSHQRGEEDAAWREGCRAELVKLQRGDAENVELWKKFIQLSMVEFERMYTRLGVEFEMVRGESYYRDRDREVAAMLVEKGLARESEGALVAFFDEGEGLPPCIIQKSDGGYNYATSDVATIFTRNEDFAPTAVLYVTDERQRLHFRQCFRLAAAAGNRTRLEHIWFGLMRLPEGLLSTRAGTAIKLERLLDEAERRARVLVDGASPGMSEAGRAAVARAVGIGAVKYADLSQNRQSEVTFTWEKALSMEGNSAPYLQYACARASSILGRHRERYAGEDICGARFLLEDPRERRLAIRIARVPEAVVEAGRQEKPSVLADALFELGQAYSSFYQMVPCLRAPDAGRRRSRVRLCVLAGEMLRFGLGLLGIEAPERM